MPNDKVFSLCLASIAGLSPDSGCGFETTLVSTTKGCGCANVCVISGGLYDICGFFKTGAGCCF